MVGAVNQPGTQQLQGKKTLMQMISMVGGFRPDAGNTLKITRDLQWGPLPLPNASTDSSGKFSVAEIRVPDLLQGKNPQLNILVMPNDVITIPSSETVYVVGDVHKAGGFLLGERQEHVCPAGAGDVRGHLRNLRCQALPHYPPRAGQH